MIKLNLNTVDERSFCIAFNKILTENNISPMLHGEIMKECRENGIVKLMKKKGVFLSEESVGNSLLKELK